MAYRPKTDECDESFEEAGPTSKIFKSLGDSEAGRSFRNVNVSTSGRASFTRGSVGGGPSSARRGGDNSFTRGSREDGGEEEVRSVRANAAMQMRESLDPRRRAGGVKLPRGQTFERKAATAADAAYADDDAEDDEDENAPPPNGGAARSLAQRSSLVAQLEMRQAGSADGDAALRKEAAKASIHARFKSTTAGGAIEPEDGLDDDDVIATA
jgi:hypothetical protein